MCIGSVSGEADSLKVKESGEVVGSSWNKAVTGVTLALGPTRAERKVLATDLWIHRLISQSHLFLICLGVEESSAECSCAC